MQSPRKASSSCNDDEDGVDDDQGEDDDEGDEDQDDDDDKQCNQPKNHHDHDDQPVLQ